MPRANPGKTPRLHSERAAWAWDQMKPVDRGDAEYATHVRKLPSRLLTNGLGPTLAFLFAKGKVGDSKGALKGPALLFDQLAQRMEKMGFLAEDSRNPRGVRAMEVLLKLDPRDYRHLSIELVETAEWLKRLAEGRLPKPKGETDR